MNIRRKTLPPLPPTGHDAHKTALFCSHGKLSNGRSTLLLHCVILWGNFSTFARSMTNCLKLCTATAAVSTLPKMALECINFLLWWFTLPTEWPGAQTKTVLFVCLFISVPRHTHIYIHIYMYSYICLFVVPSDNPRLSRLILFTLLCNLMEGITMC